MHKLKLLCPNYSVFSDKIIFEFKKKFDCTILNIKQNKFDRICHNFDIILLRHTHNIKYKKNSNIKYILSPTTGLNHIDQKIIKMKKIKIFFLKDKNILKNIRATAEHTIFLMLYLLRKKSLRAKFGLKNNYKNLISEEIYKKKIGIIGYGRIGKMVKKILNSFKANTTTFDLGDNYKKLYTIFKNSDIITLHINGNKNNFNFINKNHLKLMKDTSLLINTSRGEIINEKDLLKAIEEKKLRIGLDVIKNENNKNNFSQKKAVLYNKNILITPHVGGLTRESITKTDMKILKQFYEETKI